MSYQFLQAAKQKLLLSLLVFAVMLSGAVCQAYGGRVESAIGSDSTDYEVYYFNPQKMDRPFSYNSHRMRSASMIKVFILGQAMEEVKAGRMSLDETIVLQEDDKVGGAGILVGYDSGSALSVDTILRLMIIESDNTATNMMIDRLGFEAINDYIARNGYADSLLQRKMMDFEAVAAGRENYTSANDLGKFFTLLYNHQCVSRELDDVMLGYLKDQTDDECLPAANPGSVVAHKTGELAGLIHDGGIVYGPQEYVIVLMADDFEGREAAINRMISINHALLD